MHGMHIYTCTLNEIFIILYVFYSLLSIQKHRVCVKGHHNKPQTPMILIAWNAPLDSEIPGSATDCNIKFYIILYTQCPFQVKSFDGDLDSATGYGKPTGKG